MHHEISIGNFITYRELLIFELVRQQMHQQTLAQIDQWKIIKKIGDGSFGQIYQAIACSSQNIRKEYVAIKTQSITNVKQMLLLQYQIYRQFCDDVGFPRIFSYGEKQYFSYMVMQKFQITLDKYAAKLYPNDFVPKNSLLTIMNASLRIIQRIHQKGYLYRDMKPSNFMLKQPYDQLYIIDFGLSKPYMNNGKHIKEKIGKKLVGTPVFCSLNTHKGLEQSRRDDIQCWIYTMLYLSVILPWEKILSKNAVIKQEQYKEIGKIKSETNWQQIIKGNKNIPESLFLILQNSKCLQFDENPNYQLYFKAISQQYRKSSGRSLTSNNQIQWKQPKSVTDPEPKKKVNKINFKIKKQVVQKENIDQQTSAAS